MAPNPQSPSGSAAQGPPKPTGNGPYSPQIWQFGGVPTVNPDLYICAVFLALYVLSATIHMTIFQINKKRSHLFALSAMTFGFSMCRIFTFSLRLSWSVKQRNASIALASNSFVAAGTPILYIINLVFAHRIIRAQHPKLGWHKALSLLARVIVVSVVGVLILLIFAGIAMSFTLNTALRQRCRDIQLFGTTFYTFIAFLPLPMVFVGLVLPKRIRTEKFGQGRFRTKILVLVTSTLLLTLRAVWGTTATWLTPVPRIQAIPWYYSKPAFYCVQLLPELLVVYLYAFVRVDRRFFTPTGQRNSYLNLPGTLNPNSSAATLNVKKPEAAYHGYITASEAHRKNLNEKSIQSSKYNSKATNSLTSSIYPPLRIFSEEELFSETATLASTLNPNIRSSLVFNEERDNFELVGGDADSFYQYSASGSRANVNMRSVETRQGQESTQSRWSLQSMQELRGVEEQHDTISGR
ncbi:hypothetical protein EG328_009577 [Venturia inaequalis]|uniref:Uncharacterized protein n=1 Tax=Venturia inaequalis TaxID=5025 RepID=A0A8H3UEE0_VENIN|nr:hypothetical protein EG328_009577 [Venturia inaequalis]KAE9968100.1 hypothetical protein EG327_011186 [Venturia inaequalis]